MMNKERAVTNALLAEKAVQIATKCQTIVDLRPGDKHYAGLADELSATALKLVQHLAEADRICESVEAGRISKAGALISLHGLENRFDAAVNRVGIIIDLLVCCSTDKVGQA